MRPWPRPFQTGPQRHESHDADMLAHSPQYIASAADLTGWAGRSEPLLLTQADRTGRVHGVPWGNMGVNGITHSAFGPDGRIQTDSSLCSIKANEPLAPRRRPGSSREGLESFSTPRPAKACNEWKKYQSAYKPGFVWPAAFAANVAAIPLGPPLLTASCNLPGRLGRKRPGGCPPHRPYSVLLPMGFTLPLPSPAARWALTPPFHPYPAITSALRPV